MGNRQRAERMAERGASAKEIRKETGVTSRAANRFVNRAESTPTLSQQPMPSYNPSVQNARYITDLNPVGSPEFNRWNEKLGGNYDGGGWVTWNKNFGPGDSGMLASDDEMRAFARANAYREMNNLGLMNRGSIESDAAKFQAALNTAPGGAKRGYLNAENQQDQDIALRILSRLQGKQERIQRRAEDLDQEDSDSFEDFFPSNRRTKRLERLKNKSKKIAEKQNRFQNLLNQMSGF